MVIVLEYRTPDRNPVDISVVLIIIVTWSGIYHRVARLCIEFVSTSNQHKLCSEIMIINLGITHNQGSRIKYNVE